MQRNKTKEKCDFTWPRLMFSLRMFNLVAGLFGKHELKAMAEIRINGFEKG